VSRPDPAGVEDIDEAMPERVDNRSLLVADHPHFLEIDADPQSDIPRHHQRRRLAPIAKAPRGCDVLWRRWTGSVARGLYAP
jgi:hypothetical protein